MTIAQYKFTIKIQSIGLTTNCHSEHNWYNRTQSRWTQPNI